jgi:predicted Zn-dependent protease with MMP-like domain
MRRRAASTADRVKRIRFQRLVEQAVRTLPPDILAQLDNVDIVVEDEPNPDQLREFGDGEDELFGLYEGTPLVERSSAYSLVVPDRIVIFRGPLERAFSEPREIAEEVRITVLHELAHHFGFDEERIAELGLA